MFSIFNTNKQQSTDEVTEQSTEFENSLKGNSNDVSEKEIIHGKDGVCCGGCGGE